MFVAAAVEGVSLDISERELKTDDELFGWIVAALTGWVREALVFVGVEVTVVVTVVVPGTDVFTAVTGRCYKIQTNSLP